MADLRKCTIEGCDRTVYARNWCRKHYDFANRNGTPAPLGIREKSCESCGATILFERTSRKFCDSCLRGRQSARHSRARASRASKLRKLHLSLEQYDAMVAARNGTCDICGKVPVAQNGSLCVDHDHATGAIRGLLCSPCNRAIGLLGDTYEDMLRAAQYLEIHSAYTGTPLLEVEA